MRQLAIGVSLALAATACKVGPDYEPPQPELPEGWRELPEDVAAVEVAPDLARWWRSLGDPALTAVVERAIATNLDLAQALARLDAVRASRGIAASELYPVVSADGSYTYRYFGSEAFGFRPGGSSTFDDLQGAMNASWEIDFFGRIRRTVEAADAEIGASIEDYRALLVTLTSEVARLYVQIRAFQRRIDIAEKNLEAQVETLELTRARQSAGLAPELDVARAETTVETTRARVPALEQALHEALHRLAVLLGEAPGVIDAELLAEAGLPQLASALPAAVPAAVIRRRPDVRRAERELAARTAAIGVAEAGHWPRVSLAGALGISTIDLDVIDGRVGFGSIGPRISWDLLRGGAVASEVAGREALRVEATLAFEGAVLLALEDVENALGGFQRERRRADALRRAVTRAGVARDQAETLYVRGLSDFNAVLDAERTLLDVEDQLAVSEGEVLLQLVRLYAALGGGWDDEVESE